MNSKKILEDNSSEVANSVADEACLAKAVVDELEAEFYAEWLLCSAEDKMASVKRSTNQHYAGMLDRFIVDQDKLAKLLDESAARVYSFMQTQAQRSAIDSNLEKRIACWQRARDVRKQSIPVVVPRINQELTELENAVNAELVDPIWVVTLLSDAAERAKNHYDFACLGHYARSLGTSVSGLSLSESYYHQAAECCENSLEFKQLVNQLRYFKEPEMLQRKVYTLGETRLNDALQRLHWAEGIVQLFKDYDWARKAYNNLDDLFNDPAAQQKNRPAYYYSRRYNLNEMRNISE